MIRRICGCGVARSGVEERVSAQLDVGFGVEIVLIGFPACEEIDLPLDLFLGRQRPVAGIHHETAVSEGRPVMDLHFRQKFLSRAFFHQLPDGLRGIVQTGGRSRANFGPFRTNADFVGFSGVRPRPVIRARKGVDTTGPLEHDAWCGNLPAHHWERRSGAFCQSRRQFIGCEPVFSQGA